MLSRKANSIINIIGIVIVLFNVSMLFPMDAQSRESAPTQTRLESVKTGGHPEYTRILISLSERAKYQVQADFVKKRVSLTLENTVLAGNFKSKVFNDRNLDKVEVDQVGNNVKISLLLKDPNSRFIHFTKDNPPQIVVDLKGVKNPYIQTKVSNTHATEPPVTKAKEKEKEKAVKKQDKATPGVMSPEEIEANAKKATEEKEVSGWEDYLKALKAFQDKKYAESLPLFRKYMKDHPKSVLLDNVAYLIAEATYKVGLTEKPPTFEKAVSSYLYAIRQFPESKFQDHALMKLAHIYSELGYGLEAKTLFDESLRAAPDSLYTPYRNLGMASLMLYDKKFDDAYEAFQKILKDSPKDEDARKALFQIADWYYEQKDFAKALKIYEDAETRWPIQFSRSPLTMFNMAEIFFTQKKYAQARSRYFQLINLSPEEGMAHKALNRVGDSYLIEGKYMPALSVFDESAKKKPGSHESQYSTIRMADIGVRDSTLPLRDIIFNLKPYYHPFKTYEQVFKEGVDVEILSEVTLSLGIAYLHEQRYLESIKEFKKLLPMGPESKYYQEAQKYIKQALVLLVDRFAKQTGNLPILYTFTDYQSLSLGEIDNIKTLLQIGEAYQAISMHQEAARYYEKVKKMDANGVYTDRIFLNLGQIHLAQKNYNEAEVVAKAFINKYPESSQVPEAMRLLASSYRGRKQYDQAIQTYQDILSNKKFKEDIAKIHYDMGDTYAEMNQVPAAIQSYQKTIDSYDRSLRITPEYVPEAYYKLGILHYSSKNFPKALETLKSARELFPKSEFRDWNGYMVADILEQLTEKDQATAELNKVLQSETASDLMKQVADSKLKMMDWEKKFKEFL